MDADGVVELLGKVGAGKVRVYSNRVQASCPFALWDHQNGRDNQPSMSVRVGDDRSVWLCFACGRRGSLAGLVYQWAEKTRKNPTELLDYIERREGSLGARMSRVETRLARRWAAVEASDEDFEVWDDVELKPFVGSVPQYILDRGISIEQCRAWELGFDRAAPRRVDGKVVHDTERVVFPVRRADGRLVGLAGRRIHEEDEPKFWNYWHFEKSNFLYGMNKISDSSKLVLVEGFIDVIVWQGYGLPAVGVMGNQMSDAQAKQAAGFASVYLAFDDDDAGRKGTSSVIGRLRKRTHLFRCEFFTGKRDPKEHTKEEAFRVVATARLVL